MFLEKLCLIMLMAKSSSHLFLLGIIDKQTFEMQENKTDLWI